MVRVVNPRDKFIGQALYSPASEIRLRLLEPTERPIDAAWWRERIASCLDRRKRIDATAFRVVHGEGDALPSLIVDRYDRWVVAQILSAGLETQRELILAAILEVLQPEGILLRNDASVRRREGLEEEVEVATGEIPAQIEIREGSVRYLVELQAGQKTGAFLDQRENRLVVASLTKPGGRALDCFSYHGSFALHLGHRAATVIALDTSKTALARGAANAALNGLTNIEFREGDAFEALRQFERSRERFDTVVVDPPAFAKSRSDLEPALRGYHEINVRAMRLLAPGGLLLTASCSFHIRRPEFYTVIARAAADSGRRLSILSHLGQPADHPEVVTIPESGYLKGLLLRAD